LATFLYGILFSNWLAINSAIIFAEYSGTLTSFIVTLKDFLKFFSNSFSIFFTFAHCFHIKTPTLLVNMINSASLAVFLIIILEIPV